MPETRIATFHVSLNVTDLDRSIAFYDRLFDLRPAKVHADYAKFEVAEPPLILALHPGGPVHQDTPHGGTRAAVGHFGLRLDAAALENARERLREAGVTMRDEGFTTCCYADQRKFWVNDPDGNEWEVYEFLGDSPTRDGDRSACCS